MEKILKELDNCERIGVIGSPSSTGGLTLDILGTAISKKLVGNLGIFHFMQDERDHYALGQITEIQMQNIWTQDPTMRGIIKQKGRVDPITEKQDIHVAKMTVSAVFSQTENSIGPSILGTVPSTGTSINLVNENIMDALLADCKSELFHLGKAYGTNIQLPMWFKHFGSGDMGAGEAYHIGIFGKTGSGKSILGIMMMTAYIRHKNMSILVLDPQGQFSREFNRNELRELVEEKLGREILMINLHNLVLSGYSLFKKIIINSGFLIRWCNIKYPDNQGYAADQIVNILLGKIPGQDIDKIKPWDAHKKEAFKRIWNEILTNEDIQRRIYTSEDSRKSMITAMINSDVREVYEEWRRIANLFSYQGKRDSTIIKDLIQKIIPHENSDGVILTIDLSESHIPEDIFWNEQIRFIIMGEFLSHLINHAEEQYRQEKLLNTLVIIDEAHRLAPREKIEDVEFERLRDILIDGVRTTRKYGLGWMFISQTLSSLHRQIINQIRIYVFGFGLALGVEGIALKEIVGGAAEAIKLYQTFRDPQSSIGERKFPFMTFGPISPLSFSSMPLFINALKYPQEFLKINFEL